MATKKIDWEQRLYDVARDVFTMDDSNNAENSIEAAAHFIEKLKEYESEHIEKPVRTKVIVRKTD